MSFEIDPLIAIHHLEELAAGCTIPVKNILANANKAFDGEVAHPMLVTKHDYTLPRNEIRYVSDSEHDEPVLQPVTALYLTNPREVKFNHTTRDFDVITPSTSFLVYKNLGDTSNNYSFGFTKDGMLHRICTFVERGNLPDCSYALFDEKYLNHDTVGTMVCTTQDEKRPLVWREDEQDHTDVLTLTGKVVRNIETLLSNKVNPNSDDTGDDKADVSSILANALNVNDTAVRISVINDQTPYNTRRAEVLRTTMVDVQTALSQIALSGVDVKKELLQTVAGNEFAIEARIIPLQNCITVTARPTALKGLGNTFDKLIFSLHIEPGTKNLTRVEGEWSDLFGDTDKSSERRQLHALAKLFDLEYAVSASSEADVPEMSEFISVIGRNIESGITPNNRDMDGRLIEHAEKPFHEQIREFLNEYDLPTKVKLDLGMLVMKNIPVLGFFGHNDLTQFIKADIAHDRSPENTGNYELEFKAKNSTEILQNRVFEGLDFKAKTETKEYDINLKRIIKPMYVDNSIFVDCRGPIDGFSVVFGHEYTQYEKVQGNNYVEKVVPVLMDSISVRTTIINPVLYGVIKTQSGIYFALNHQAFVFQPRVSQRQINHGTESEPVVVDIKNFNPKNYPRKHRKAITAAVNKFKEAHALAESMGIDFDVIATRSLLKNFPGYDSKVQAKIAELL